MGLRVARSRAAFGLLTATSALLVFAAAVACAVILHARNATASPVGTRAAILSAQAAMYVAAVVTMLLAGVALTLGARLVASVRERDVWMLRARGFSAKQVFGLSVPEAVFVALPAAIFAPPLAACALWAVRQFGAATAATGDAYDRAEAADAPLMYGVGPWLWFVAVAIAAAGVAALVLVGQRSGAAGTSAQKGRASLLQAGLDVLIGMLAALAVWQLLRNEGPLTGAASDQAVDPLIVAAPALVLFTGALIALRLLLFASRRLDGAATRTRGVGRPLGVWQLSRRSTRQVGPTLLLVLALGVGTLVLTYTHSWSASQAVQADVAAGAAISIGANPQRQSAAIAQQLDAVNGVEEVTAVLTGLSRSGRMLAIDAERAQRMVNLRPDMITSHATFADALDDLLAKRPQAPAIALPDGTVAIDVGVTVGGDFSPADVGIWTVIIDGTQVLHRPFRASFDDDAAPTGTASITIGRDEAGEWGAPVDGASVLAIDLVVPETISKADSETLTISVSLAAVAADGTTTALETPEAWRATYLPPREFFYEANVWGWDDDGEAILAPEEGPHTLHALTTGEGNDMVSLDVTFPEWRSGRIALRPAEADDERVGTLTQVPEQAVLPALATFDGYITTTVAAHQVLWEPVGHITALPGLGLEDVWRDGFIADLPSVSLAVFEASGNVVVVDQFWLSPEEGRLDEAVAALNASPFGPVTGDRSELEAEWQADPLGQSVVEAMWLALAAAALFAAVGVALAAVVAVRERRAELAVLRAMGSSPRQITGSIVMEHALLLGTGILLGGGLGIALSHLLLPRLVRDVRGVRPVPPVQTLVPWLQVVVLVAVIVAATATAVVLVARSLSKTDVVAELRREGAQ